MRLYTIPTIWTRLTVNASLLINLEPCGPFGRSISQPPSTLYYTKWIPLLGRGLCIRVEELCAYSQQLVVRVAYLKCMFINAVKDNPRLIGSRTICETGRR
jgi:hypothetical protein